MASSPLISTACGLAKRSQLSSSVASPSNSSSTSNVSFHSDLSDSDDEEGVFFGAHDPTESEMVAKLSAESPISLGNQGERRRSAGGNRLRKRDSREFLRRKTLLLPSVGNLEPAKASKESEKLWHGGFYERRDGGGEESDERSEDDASFSRGQEVDVSTPSKGARHLDQSHSELTLDFAAFQLTEAGPRPPRRPDPTSPEFDDSTEVDSDEEDSDSSSDVGQSDKENVEVHFSPEPEEESEHDQTLDPAITVGFDRREDEDDVIEELDMGGLRLSDLSDPDMMYEAAGPKEDSLEYGVTCEDDDLGVDMASLPSAMEPFAEVLPAADMSSSIGSEPEISDVFVVPPSTYSMDLNVAGDVSADDSPLPVARAGPVVIPDLSHYLGRSIRAETGTPSRALPASPSTRRDGSVDIALAEEPTVRLAQMTSPSREQATPFTARTPRQLLPLPVGTTPSTRQPLAPPSLVLPAPGSKLLKSTLGSAVIPASVDRPRVVSVKEKEAALTIRKQLDEATAPQRLVSSSAPQRTVSSSSSSSSSSAASGRPGRLGMGAPSRPGMLAPKVKHGIARDPKKGPERPTVSVPASRVTNQTMVRPPSRIGSSVSAPNRYPSGLPAARPPAPKPVSTSTIPRPRPVLTARPMTQTTSARPAPPVASKLAKPRSVPNLKAHVVQPAVRVEVPVPVLNPLKRPLSAMQPALARSMVTTTSAPTQRSTLGLGLPSRPVPLHSSSLSGGFSVGFTESSLRPAGPSRSPARSALMRRPDVRGTPVRSGFLNVSDPGSSGIKVVAYGPWQLGTPSRFGTPKQSQPKVSSKPFALGTLLSHPPIPASTTKPAHRQAAVEEPTVQSDGPAAGGSAKEVGAAGQRGSSEDVEDVSFVLPPAGSSDRGSSPQEAEEAQPIPNDVVTRHRSETSSPSKQPDTLNDRPKRAIRPTKPQQTAGQARGRAPPSASIVPGISEKELKAITDLNTAKNEVRQFAMDRQIVRVPGPRPPSPDSKLRTSIDREDDEKRNSRDGRARRRAGEEEPAERPVVERIIRNQGPGEDQDYETPARPLKKQRTAAHDEACDERFVRWDRGLVVIRDDGRRVSPSPSGDLPNGNRSCMKDHQLDLDHHGNVIEGSRPPLKIKLPKVTITAVFYEGEDPTPPVQPSQGTRSKKK